jgi:Secretion system C-terminal sorting domain
MKTSLTRFSFFLIALVVGISQLTAQIYWTEEFNGGLNGWTMEAIQEDSVFTWSPNGLMTGGILGGQGETLNAPTNENGCMLFNADFYSTSPTGSVPPPPYPQYICDLISPVIDLSAIDADTRLDIEFYHMYRRFQAVDGYTFSSYAVSTDGGTTWTERMDAGAGLLQTTGNNGVPTNNGKRVVRIPFDAGLAGSNNVKIKFTFAGNFYFWGIDDISIVRRADFDTQISTAWYARAPYRQLPLSQAEPIVFMSDIENIGSETATGVSLDMTVTRSGNTVYNEVLAYGDLIPDSLAENEVFGGYIPDEKGTYTGTYTLNADNMDENPANNSVNFQWSVTDSVFAKENGATRIVRPADGNWDDGEPKTWTYGNHFFINNGDGYIANTASFIVQGDAASAGQTVVVNLWKWNAPLDAWAADPVLAEYYCLPEDRERVGYGFYTIGTNDALTSVKTVGLTDELTLEEGVPLEDNTHYVLMLEYTDTGAGNVVNFGANDGTDFAPAIFASRLAGAPRMASMLGIDTNLDAQPFSDVGFGQNLVVCVRLNVTEMEAISTTNVLTDASLHIYPSPANEDLTVDVKLGKQYKDALINVVDVRGAVMMEQHYDELQKQRLTFDVGNWTNGTYFLQVITAEGVKSQHFAVQH